MNCVSEDAGCKIWRENTTRKGLSDAVARSAAPRSALDVST